LRETKKSELENNLTAQGEDFAFPLYDYLLEKHGIEAVLEFDLDKIGFKTKFLRSKPELAKVSWINDIQQEHDVHHAAETLVELALMKEQQVWNKKIELSLGKLALLAEAEDSSKSLQLKADEARRAEAIGTVDKELIAIKIQDQLFNHVFPSTFEAVDESAAVNLAIEAHSGNIPKRQKALQQVFEEGMKRLLKHEALDAMTLIDLLTLVSFHPESGSELIASPFWMAWKVADSCCHSDEVKDAKRLIWRRLLIRDPWGKINDTQLKNDVEVSLRLAQTELFEMLADCIRYQDVREPFRPMPPRDALGAFTKDLDRRFRDFDADFQTKLKDAMKWEDKTLTQHLEKHRLGEWVKTTFEAAQFEVQNDIDETTRIGAESQNSANVNSAAVRPLFGQA
jgi:nuclear pore complex protein Nup133